MTREARRRSGQVRKADGELVPPALEGWTGAPGQAHCSNQTSRGLSGALSSVDTSFMSAQRLNETSSDNM